MPPSGELFSVSQSLQLGQFDQLDQADLLESETENESLISRSCLPRTNIGRSETLF